MKKVILTGRLAKEFGPEFELEISSTAEAVRALCYQIPGFEESLKKGHYRVTKIKGKNKTDLGEESIHMGLGSADAVRISPVIRGNKKGGIGKIILGAALIGLAFFMGPSTVMFGGALGATATYGYLGMMGAMMMLNGVASMLTPQTKAPKSEEKRESYLLDATGNLTEQGNAVPLVYGEVFTGSVVVSAGMSVEELPFVQGENTQNFQEALVTLIKGQQSK